MEKLEVIRRHTGGMDFCVVRFAPDVHPTVQTRSFWQSPRVSLERVGGNVTRYACHLDRFCTIKPWRCRCVFLVGVVGVTRHSGNEKADELAKGGALLDKEFMKEARVETLQQERDKVYASFFCSFFLPFSFVFSCLTFFFIIFFSFCSSLFGGATCAS